MIAVRQRLLTNRRGAMILLALVFAIRALIPQGMMAAPDAVRGVAVLLCDGTGTAGRIDLPMDGTHGRAGKAEACPFGVLTHAATADMPDVWAIPVVLPQAFARRSIQLAFILAGMRRPRPPARAPPRAA